MLKKSILIGMFGLCIANVGYSSTLTNIFHPKKSALTKSQIKEKVQSNYTDFTGKWIGHCDDESDNLLTIKIENDEYTITINHERFKITGLNSRASSVSKYSYNETTSLNWNDDKTALIFNDVNYFHKASNQMPPQASTLEVEVRRSMLELKNGELVFSAASTTYIDGLAAGNAESFVCHLRRNN